MLYLTLGYFYFRLKLKFNHEAKCLWGNDALWLFI